MIGMFIWPDSYHGALLIPVILLVPLGVFNLYAGVVQLALVVFAMLRLTRKQRKKPDKDALDRLGLAGRLLGIYLAGITLTNLLVLGWVELRHQF